MACRMSILCCNSASSLRNAFLQVLKVFQGLGERQGQRQREAGFQRMEAGSGVRHAACSTMRGAAATGQEWQVHGKWVAGSVY